MVIVGGGCPSFDDMFRVVGGEPVVLAEGVEGVLVKARSVLVSEASRRPVYGYCTGLGALYDSRGFCGPGWERSVLLEHAVGVGPEAPAGLVRLFMFIRLSQMVLGFDPVRPVVALRIVEALNANITPRVPLRGSLGASGDLVPAAHAFLCIYYGEGSAYKNGMAMSCGEALRSGGLEPLPLESGEALALINSTAWSTALLAYSIAKLERLIGYSLAKARETLEVCRCNPEHYIGDIAGVKRHPGIALALEKLGSPACGGPVRLQDPYSLRCIPYIYAPVIELVELSKSIVEREACSPSTNPLILGDKVVHSCAFYASHIAMAADALAIAAAHIANSIERRIAQIMRGEITGLPEFLAKEAPAGAMILHYVASAITARIRLLANPASTHTTPVSHLQEDVTPQAAEAALKLMEIADLLEELVNLEAKVLETARTIRERD
ncbi:MAG: aromatic amino acid ammonia-lyase [Thermoprotei archaeon]|nr:aromatic amino acid ammonia-lyase [Thermoprotei archaeon]